MTFIEEIRNAISRSFTMIIEGMSNAIPKIILILILLLVGWLIGKLIKKLITKGLTLIKLDEAMEKLELSPILGQIGIKSAAKFIGAISYWMVMLVVLLTITEILNMAVLTTGVAAILAYIPQLLISLAIFLFGMFIANMIKNVVYNATNSIGLSGARVISNIIYYVLFIFIAITAINQTGVDTSIITSNVTMIFGAILLAFAVSYGIASRNIMSNMLSSFYKKDRFKKGMRIRVSDVEGVVSEIDSLSITIDTGDKRVVLPTRLLIEEKVEILG
jgi:hypothetical protein